MRSNTAPDAVTDRKARHRPAPSWSYTESSAARLLRVLLAVELLLVGVYLLTQLVVPTWGVVGSLFNLGEDQSVPSWFSATQLAAVAAAFLLATIGRDVAHRLPNTSSMTFPGVDAPGMLILLDERGIACSAGSACHTASLHPSHVLEAMGFDAEHARSTLRFSWSRFNTMEETLRAADEAVACAKKMRELRGSGPVVG